MRWPLILLTVSTYGTLLISVLTITQVIGVNAYDMNGEGPGDALYGAMLATVGGAILTAVSRAYVKRRGALPGFLKWASGVAILAAVPAFLAVGPGILLITVFSIASLFS